METEELGITAGLQDRVVQVMNGCVGMEFKKDLIETTGNGAYHHIDVSLLPPLFVAYCERPENISFRRGAGVLTTLQRVPLQCEAAVAHG